MKSQYAREQNFALKTFKEMNNNFTIIRQNIGIDISKDSFMASIALQKSDLTLSIASTKKFDNNSTGFEKLLVWTSYFVNPALPLSFTMEATGVYRTGELL